MLQYAIKAKDLTFSRRLNIMWAASKCNLCGDCLVKCLYVEYDKDKAVANIKALVEGKKAEILNKCVTFCACREYSPT